MNEIIISNTEQTSDTWTKLDTSYSLEGILFIGNNEDGGSDRSYTSAIRFTGVTATGAVNYAALYLYVEYNGKDETPRDGEWKFRVYGIDEDNTATFSSEPFGRSKTTAYNDSSNADEPDTGVYKEITITSAVNEVFSRGGWSSGNALGLIIENNGSGKNKYAGEIAARNSYLVIRQSAEPNTFPTPGTTSAPTFPDADDYGIKVSRPGVNVSTASESDLFFTTRKKVVKVLSEGGTTLADGLNVINHNLGYAPLALGYVNSLGTTGNRFKLPRTYYGTDPVGGGVEGRLETNGTSINIRMETGGSTVNGYYYAFIDKLP